MLKRLLPWSIGLLLSASSAFATVDQSSDIKAVLEFGSLSQSDCDRYHAGQTDKETTLRCGKYLFLFDSLGFPGLPQGLVDVLRNNAPKTVGKSFQSFGMKENPYSPNQLPVGLHPGLEEVGFAKTYTITCAACHFGQVADGRYVVGQANHQLDFAKLTLSVALAPQLAPNPKKKLPPHVEKLTRPIWDEFFTGFNGLKVIGEIIKLLPNVIASGKQPITDAAADYLASAPPGVLDPLASPGYEDFVTSPQRILSVYGIDPEGMSAAGSSHGLMLTSAGGTFDLTEIFLAQAKIAEALGGKNYFDMYGPEYYKPLEAYILHLKAPKNLAKLDPIKIEAGERLFQSNCVSCHNGPDYSGTRIFDLAEIGTDPNQQWFMDSDKDGKAIGGLLKDSEMTGGVKVQRLSGIWSYGRLLHNGSLSSLEELFCLENPRPESIGEGMSTKGHEMTCNDFSKDQKLDLLEFIKSL